MNLLPKSSGDFASAEYWEQFFQKRGSKAFEWYGEYPELCGLLHKYIKPTDKILVIGCGNSQLSADMYDVGYQSIVNIDISSHVIKQMTAKNKETRPNMKFLKMDVTEMEFEDGEFSVVLDKGTLDALLTDAQEATVDVVTRMFKEVDRVLRMGGRYVCVSLAQAHIVQTVLDSFTERGWMIRVHQVTDMLNSDERELTMPVFIFVFTKFKKLPNMKQIFEVALFTEKAQRLDSVEDIKSAVKHVQQYGLVQQHLRKGTHQGEQLSLDLINAQTGTPRYTLHIVDSKRKCPNKFAIFIVPEGRETEWMFSSNEGRMELSKNAGFERLLVVTLHRDQEYGGMEGVKAELSAKVMDLAPPGCTGKQVPFLSIGDDISTRNVKEKGHSDMSGDYVVEDVNSEGTMYRRLVFSSNRNVIQSEARLVAENTKKKGGKKVRHVIDKSYLSCQHHGVMVAGLALVDNFKTTYENHLKVLLVGLGGGGLPVFIHRHLPKVHLDVVELDAAIANMAEKWFGFSPSEHLQVHIADGLDYIKSLQTKGDKVHILMLDADSKDIHAGMSCPPQAFVKPDFLRCIDSVLEPTGVFILNLVCRNQTLREEVIASIKSIFKSVHYRKVPEEVNEIVFGFPSSRTEPTDLVDGDTLSKRLLTDLKTVQGYISSQTASPAKDLVKLTREMDGLDLL